MRRAVWNGAVIAESDRTLVVDGYQYFPAEAVHWEYLEPSGTQTRCPWKGVASYFSITVGDTTNRDAAWCYPDPSPAAKRIGGHIAFWRGVRVEKVRERSDGGGAGEPAGPRRGLWSRLLDR